VEVEEALDKVIVTLKIFNHFRSAFREFKQKLPNYFKVSILLISILAENSSKN
jgi:hypothetical protein